MSWITPKKRCLVKLDLVKTNLITGNKKDISGWYEAVILEEKDGLVKLQFKNSELDRENEGRWLKKEGIKIL